MQTVTEPERTLPVSGEFEIIICGGGPAGISAACAAARRGRKTLLLERNNCLGGIWTAGLMPWILDQHNKHGFLAELRREIPRHGGWLTPTGKLGIPPEEFKYLLERFALDSGVTIRYGMTVAGAVRDNRTITHVITESKSGREAWKAQCFIDCTGDGDLAAVSGCGFDYAGEDGHAQPSSLNGLLGGLELAEVESYLTTSNGKGLFLAALRNAGVEPTYDKPTLIHFGSGVFGLMSFHGYGTCPFSTQSITEMILKGRDELHRQVDALRRLGGVWRNIVLLATSEQLGIREGRRIHGRETVTGDHLKGIVKTECPVCRITAQPDIHAPEPNRGSGIVKVAFRCSNYDIPWGALLSADRDNLLMAGRCISGDFIAHSSYRMSGNAIPMGEAAGIGAALAVQMNCLPPEVPFEAMASQIEL